MNYNNLTDKQAKEIFEDNEADYYIAVFDNKQEGIKDKFLKKDSNGFVKVYLTDIWNDLPDYVKEKNCNVYKLVTYRGREIIATPEHPLLILNKDTLKLEYKEMQKITTIFSIIFNFKKLILNFYYT